MKATSEELAIVSVVESGSFSRAAEQLGKQTSGASGGEKEEKPAVSLLNRTTRQLSLTEEAARALFSSRTVNFAGDGSGRIRNYGNA